MKSIYCISLSILLLLWSSYLQAQITIESGAEVTILSGETITAEGDVDNAGTISGKGALNVSGNYTNTGTLAIVIGPDQSTHTTITITGTFTPGGSFTVTNDTYTPSGGDQATIISSGGAIGSSFSNTDDNSWFANYNLPASGDFTISYGAVLPVELIYFKGESINNAVQLNWKTATEHKNEGFEIEYSIDGFSWVRIGFVPGAGTTFEEQAYFFLHGQPAAGNNYYRLKQLDFDGRSEYSEIVSVGIDDRDQQVQIFPNPIQNDELRLQLSQIGNKIAIARLYDGFGRMVQIQKLNDLQTTLSLRLLSDGIYYMEVQLDQQIIRERVILVR